jgi:hypothetical protein
MALKLVITDPSDVPASLRGEYAKGDDGKYHLTLEGGHPDTVKLAEFRNSNRSLNAKITELEAKQATLIEPSVLEALKASHAAELAKVKGDKSEELAAQLAAEKAAHAKTQFERIVAFELSKAGVYESAVDFMVGKAAEKFVMKDGKLTTELFSEKNPGEPLTVEEWVNQQTSVVGFAFKPSRGGGAGSTGAGPSGPRVISNDPLTVGRNLEAIARGDVTVG